MIKFTKTYSYSKDKCKTAFTNPIWEKKQSSWLDLDFDLSNILGEEQ